MKWKVLIPADEIFETKKFKTIILPTGPKIDSNWQETVTLNVFTVECKNCNLILQILK